jgi:hypothetical protein
MTDLTPTDWRALCAELLEALENAIRVIYGEDGTKHISTADAVITKADAALAQPEPQGPTLNDVSELCEEFGFHLDESYDNLESAEALWEMFRAVLARWGTCGFGRNARIYMEPIDD